ncbi:MAG: hypothetical protein KBD83_04710 [Gammaproteobacteria bacterium]|nr:hypothetical protein [Gammaproteobacteria bacterium]
MRKFFVLPVMLVFFMLSVTSAAYALEDGQVTANVLGIFGSIGSVFSGICIVVGIGLICASFIQYRQHRVNKLLVPISKPIFLLILGIFLACIPLLGQHTPGGQLVSQVGS